MSNLENLISKITSDCDEKSKQIIEAAEKEADTVIKSHVDLAEKEKDRILKDSEAEALKAAERIISGKKLQIRDENLKAKREAIDKVFDFALKKLNQMSKADYAKFLCRHLSSLDLAKGELIIPVHYEITDDYKLKELLKDCTNAKDLTLQKDGKKIDGGFILIQGGIEYNYTFETLLGYQRYELESEITKILF
ncbi:MAG: V-type ATP synthase subunit E [Lachnoclostridium sp.]|jgi:V/A-type H+-transporting ATPase subunit E|nr:V-type ATP synthase subunit E [Lachnoclostridium sp.]